MPTLRPSARAVLLTSALLGAAAATVTGCGSAAGASSKAGVINVVGAENEYANVASQIGGKYVHVSSILDNPNTDPHTFESSPSVAREVSAAKLVIQNGVGYDDFMTKIESTSKSGRTVINVQHLLGLPDDTPNPHLWYSPQTMPTVVKALVNDLSSLQPAHAAYFQTNATSFNQSLIPWTNAIAAFKSAHSGTPVATTEPVADYLLQAMGTNNLTPFGFQADIMNGTDPTPQDVSLENGFFTKHQAKVFCYNQQVVDSLTTSIREQAQKSGVPVVGVYETMPTGYDYQRWMLAETQAITAAVEHGTSQEHL